MGWHDTTSRRLWSSDLVLAAPHDMKAVFMNLFGSYFGDWDRTGNMLRAVLASARYGLACSWSGRPHHYFHHMGSGETIGYGIRLSQNNDGTAAMYQNDEQFALPSNVPTGGNHGNAGCAKPKQAHVAGIF
jgi:hypothetical protein